jgi:hypothetical protein
MAAATLLLAASPSQARFLQTDPVGYTDDQDMYTYVQDDPTDKVDPNGTESGPAYKYEYDHDTGQIHSSPGPDTADVVDAATYAASAVELIASDGAAAAGPVEETVASGRAISAGLRAEQRAAQLAKNVAKGAEGEAKTAAKLEGKVAGKQVSFKTSDGSSTRADFVTKDKTVVETKTGNAKLSKNQQKLHDDINAGREVTPVGQNAKDAGLKPGEPTTMKSCTMDRPC